MRSVVFIADSIEPTRGNTPELAALREVPKQDFDKAVWLTCDYSLKFLLDTRRLVHPRTILTRNWAVQAFSQKQQQANSLTDAVESRHEI